MKKILLLSVLGLFISCANQNQECETPSNGFIEGTELNIQMGEQNGVDIFKEIDAGGNGKISRLIFKIKKTLH